MKSSSKNWLCEVHLIICVRLGKLLFSYASYCFQGVSKLFFVLAVIRFTPLQHVTHIHLLVYYIALYVSETFG
jgi:hypothetical protein